MMRVYIQSLMMIERKKRKENFSNQKF